MSSFVLFEEILGVNILFVEHGSDELKSSEKWPWTIQSSLYNSEKQTKLCENDLTSKAM